MDLIIYYLNMISIFFILFTLIKTILIKDKKTLHYSFIALFICILFWSGITICFYLFYINNADVIYRIFFIPLCLTPPCFFLTAYYFLNPDKKFKLIHLIYFIMPIITIIVVYSNKSHYWFMPKFSFYTEQNIYGPCFIIHSIYSFILVFIGLSYLIRYSVKNSGLFSKQARIIILGASVSMFINLALVFKIIPLTQMHNTLGFTFTVFCFWIAIVYHDFLDIVPIAIKEIIENISDGFIVISPKYVFLDCNKTFNVMFSEFAIKKENNMLNYLEELGFDKIKTLDFIESAITKKTTNSIEKHIFKNNYDKYFNIEVTPIYSDNKHLGTVLLFKDITQHKKNIFELELKNEELDTLNNKLYIQNKKVEELNIVFQEMANMDGLTKIYNRRFFDEYFLIEKNKVLSQITHKLIDANLVNFGVVILDIDNFKLINDTYGHTIGDVVLIQTAKIVKELIFDKDIVCRYGGEEFAILFPNTNKEGIIKATEKIRQGIDNYRFNGNSMKNIHITVSIGIAMFYESYKDNGYLNDVIKLADDRLYKAKKTGKNKVVYS